jgi:predicted nucleic acid-binding protein
MKVVVDAGVAVKWFVLEERHVLARRLVTDDITRIAPDFLPLEVANALSRKLRDGLTERSQCNVALGALSGGLVDLVTSALYLGRAFHLSVHFRHSLYDCLYLAVAEAEDAVFVTDDEKFGRKCMEMGFTERVSTLLNLVLP